MDKPTATDAKLIYARLCDFPSMPHRGLRRERLAVILKALTQAYEAGQAQASGRADAADG